MPLLSDYARRKKIEFLQAHVKPGDDLLEIGAGEGWLKAPLERRGATYRSLDLKPPADFIGDIRDWRRLGVPEGSFDVVIALEVVEHVPCFDEIRALLKPGGLLFATSPAPRWDWACAILETLGLSQKRTSPHDHLVDFSTVSALEPVHIERFGVLSQWGLFRRPADHGG